MTPAASPRRAALLTTVADDAVRGRSTLLVAPPGAGRTVALQRVAETVRARQPAVRRFTATTATASTPFGLFLGVLDAAGTRRLTVLDGLGRTALLRAAVLELGLRVVVVDEAPLADPDSAALLLELAERGTAVVAGATTGRPLPDAIRTLFAGSDATTAALPALGTAEIAAMAQEALGGPVDGALVAALEHAGAGLPGAIGELVREARASGVVRRFADLWVLHGELPPLASTTRRIGERWPALQPAQQAWLAQVAFAGSIADDAAAALASDDVADWAEKGRWTVHAAGGTAMRTPALRGGVLRQLGARARANAARRLLAALTALDRPLVRAERLTEVVCLLELNEPVDLARARAVATEFGVAESGPAERLLREHARRERSPEAQTALAEQLVYAGRGEAARPELDAAGETDARRLRAGLLGFADAEPERALALLGDPADDEGAALRVGLLRLAGRTEASLEAATALRQRSAGPIAALAALHEGLALVDLGDAAGALATVARLRADPASLRGLPGGGSSADWLEGRVGVEVRLDPEDRLLVAHHELAHHEPQPGARAPYAHLLGRIALLRADPLAAAQLLREALAAPGLWARSRRAVLQADLATALALAGDVRGAESHLPAGDVSPAQRPRVLLARAAVAFAQEGAASARVLAAEAAAEAARSGRTLDEVDATYDALRYGDDGAADRLLALPHLDGPGRDLQRRHAQAVVTGTTEALESAAKHLHAAGLVLFGIEAASAALRLRGTTGIPDRAAVARLADLLTGPPGLVLPIGRVERPSTLTAREREVAQLAAAGLPDRAVAERLGISVRTAQTHLGRAFGKLGVHRRRDLGAALDTR